MDVKHHVYSLAIVYTHFLCPFTQATTGNCFFPMALLGRIAHFPQQHNAFGSVRVTNLSLWSSHVDSFSPSSWERLVPRGARTGFRANETQVASEATGVVAVFSE